MLIFIYRIESLHIIILYTIKIMKYYALIYNDKIIVMILTKLDDL